MTVGQWQFGQGQLDPGMFKILHAQNWPRDRFVRWYAFPHEDTPGTVTIAGVVVEGLADGTLTYHIAVANVGKTSVTFSVWYHESEILKLAVLNDSVPLPLNTIAASFNDPHLAEAGGAAELQYLHMTSDEFVTAVLKENSTVWTTVQSDPVLFQYIKQNPSLAGTLVQNPGLLPEIKLYIDLAFAVASFK